MYNNDNGFDDAFAKEVLSIMKSKEHKELFAKKAFDDLGFSPESTEKALNRELPDYDVKNSGLPVAPGVAAGGTMSERTHNPETLADRRKAPPTKQYLGTPGMSDTLVSDKMLEDKAYEIMGDPARYPDLQDVANKKLSGKDLTEGEKALLSKALLSSASKKNTVEKRSQELPKIQDFPVSKTKWDKLDDKKKSFLREKYGTPPWEKKASVVDTLVAVADYLGENGMLVSEALADRLIKSFIVEAKTKEDECECECDKDEECTCKCSKKK